MRFVVAVRLAPALALLACEDKPKRDYAAEIRAEMKAVIETLGPPVKARAARIADVKKLVDAAPPTAEDAPPPKLDPPARLRELHLRENEGNTDVLFVEELADPQRGILGSCMRHLGRDGGDLDPRSMKDILEGCTQIRYFVALRPRSLDRPVVDQAHQKYLGGGFVGEALFFELADDGVKPRGGFWLTVDLTRSVEIEHYEKTDEDIDYRLMEALRREILTEIEKRLGT